MVAELVEIQQVPALLARYEQTAAAKRVAYEQPWTELVLRLLETTGVKQARPHAPGFLGFALGLDLETEQQALERLQQAGIVERSRDCWVVTGSLTVDTRADREALSLLRRHWTEVALRRMAAPRDNDWFAYNLISLSRRDLDRVRSRLQEAFREIRAIVAASEPCEVAALINLHLINWE